MVLDIIPARLQNQCLSETEFNEPSEVVEWFGAIQAQDYAGAKWALSQRLKNRMTDAAIEKAFNEGQILRTHVMRPTWHFITPTEIRWVLELTAPRVRMGLTHMDRQLGQDQAVFKKSNSVLVKALQGGKQLTRSELAPILQKAGLAIEELRLGHILIHAELDGVICSGARKGKQFTYALLDERAPEAKTLERADALAELTRRYFRSHGPAALQDFVWWSGLTTTDARQGIDAVQSEFQSETVDGKTYWFSSSRAGKSVLSKAYLLPNYDEYTVGYKDRSAIFDGAHSDKLSAFRESILTQTILIGGEIAGTWKRTIKKNEVIVEAAPFMTLKKAETQAITSAIEGYGKFLGLPTKIQL